MTIKNDDQIQILDHRQQARSKLSIWYGSRDNYYHGIKEVIANATDELSNNFEKGTITVELLKDNRTIRVTDTGRGIPIGDSTDVDGEEIPNYTVLFEMLFTSTKYDNEEDDTTGVNGVGTCVLNYSSSEFICESRYGGHEYVVHYTDGGYLKDFTKKKTQNQHGTTIQFSLDPEVYTSIEFDSEEVKDIVNEFAIASSNKNIKFVYVYGDNEPVEIQYPSFYDYFDTQVGNKSTSTIIHVPNQKDKIEEENIQFELVMTTNPKTMHKTYLNLTYLEEGGSIHNGIVYGVREYMTDYFHEQGQFKGEQRLLPSDIENSISFMVNLFNNKPEFVGQTKTSTNRQLYRDIALNHVKIALDKLQADDMESFEKFAKHIMTVHKHNERNQRATRRLRDNLTKEIQPITNRVDKLTDCKNHGLNSEIFITEGNSAEGSIVQARNSDFQASYPLRGKILNCLKASDKQIFANETITDLIKVLGCGIEHEDKNLHSFNKDKLRYGKIILANDQDEDGMQIACLVITMFYRLMPTLLRDGHIYIAQTPLYQVKTVDDEIIYFFNEREKDEGIKKLKPGYVISRNKGLGQTNKDVLHETALNPETRKMLRVSVDDIEAMEYSLNMWLGDGLDLRKEFISENLVDYLDKID